MRLLLADPPVTTAVQPGASLDDDALTALYAVPPTPGGWLRSNFAMSVDGAITGSDGRSGSVNTEADFVVFELVRALSDVVVVGAGTARGEGYGPLDVPEGMARVREAAGVGPMLPLVAVTGRGVVPETLLGAEPGRALLATHAAAEGLDTARRQLGDEHVLVCGETTVDPRRLLQHLHDRGWTRVLTEGGPHLLASFVEAGVVDELCVSITPTVVGGDSPRMTEGPSLTTGFTPRVLVEQDGTVMGRWLRDD